MALGLGRRIGPYELTALIGEGGMGKVWRAHHMALKRDDALKVLPEAFAADPERLARFRREAQILASLNHPNIAHVYGLEQADGVQALIMELVEGPTLADRIAQGPIPVDEAVPIAKQIAAALEAAHEQGVIHRDLKPANIKLRPDGVVKVLDFGLAKLLDADVVVSDLTMSPTLSAPATRAGVILGTAAYMSPEQARGKRVDRRTDIWAFGCVLFEMLAGTQAFDTGESVSDAIVSVLTKEPDWSALPPETPTHIRTLLRRCLRKDLQKRLPHIGLARIEIDEAADTSGNAGARLDSAPKRRRAQRHTLPWVLAGASTAGLAAVIALWAPWRASSPSPAMRVSVELGADASLALDQGASAILSPDGMVLAFAGRRGSTADSMLYVRRLDQLTAAPLPGTEGAMNPFFSPDGRWIAFFAGGKLKKIAVTGGAAVALCDAETGRGGWWAEDDTIVFQPVNSPTSGIGLLRVSAAGGEPVPVTSPEPGERAPRWPQVLPRGDAVLYTVGTSQASYDNANIVVQRLPDGEKKILHRGGYYGRFLPSGHLVYLSEGVLFAAPFDPERLDLTGPPVPVLQGVMSTSLGGGVQFAFADTGTALYLPGDDVSSGTLSSLHLLDQSGKSTPLSGKPRIWGTPRFSPDGRRIAVTMRDPTQSNNDVWIYDLERDTLTRLTLDDAMDVVPVWTPDGRRVAFTSNRSNRPFNLYWQRADGTGDVQRLADSPEQQRPTSWHPTGRFLAFTEGGLLSPRAIMILPIDGDEATGWKPGKPTEFISGRGTVTVGDPMFSPDGRWLAYTSNESGSSEVYVQPFPGPGGRWQVSSGGGTEPIWSTVRDELFFRTPEVEAQIMVAPYSAGDATFRSQKARPWTGQTVSGINSWTPSGQGGTMDLHPDGRRFVIGGVPDPATEPPIRQDKVVFIFDFFDELRRLAPAR